MRIGNNTVNIRNATINVRQFTPFVPVTFVAAAAATTPADGSTSSPGLTIVIPKPTGTVTGDYMIATIRVSAAAHIVTPPVGWFIVDNDGLARSYVKAAVPGEPATFTWTIAPAGRANSPRTGCISVYRGQTPIAEAINSEDVETPDTNIITFPDAASTQRGAALICISATKLNFSGANADFTATFPLVKAIEHSSVTGPYPQCQLSTISHLLDIV